MTHHDHPVDRFTAAADAGDAAPAGAQATASQDAEGRRNQMNSDLAATVQEATAQRLSDAIADYEAALDRGALMPELRALDREVARAERDHVAAGGARQLKP